jgi:site-specific DNA-methyltransferase (adenine-specific)
MIVHVPNSLHTKQILHEAEEVRLGDALALLKTLPSESFDAVITDPPFGIGFKYGNGREESNDPVRYWQWLSPHYQEMLRVLKPGGFFACWQTQLYFRYFWDWFGDDIHIYCAAKNWVQLRKVAINYSYDPVVMRYKPGTAPRCPRKGESPRNADFFVSDVATATLHPDPLAKQHPCPRQPAQVIEIVRNFTELGGKVLDPFCGSGTTGMACVIEGRSFLGFENNPNYVALAQQRIADALLRGLDVIPTRKKRVTA